MKAQVLSVEVDKVFTKRDGNGTYTATSLITQGEPYKGIPKEPREHRFFSNNPLYEQVATLKKGDWIEYKCDTGRFKNMISFEKLGSSPVVDTGVQPATQTFTQDMGNDKDRAIARAVAIKAAVETITAMIGKDMIKKSAKPDYVATEVLNMSAFYEKYLAFDEENDVEQVVESGEDIDETL